MCKDIKKEYEFKSINGKTIKLDFYSNRENNIHIDGNEFDLESAREINKKLEKYIRKQDKLIKAKKSEEKVKTCKHKNTERTHPYGWTACKDCGKLL